jgi:hypothetical protein
MSEQFSQVPTALLLDPAISDGAVRTWALLDGCYATAHAREAWPSRNTLCTLLGVSVRTMGRYLKQLESGGYLSIEQRKSDAGDWLSNKYTLRKLSTESPELSPKRGLKLSTVPAMVQGGTCTDAQGVPAPVAHKPYPYNHTKEQPIKVIHRHTVESTRAYLDAERHAQ